MEDSSQKACPKCAKPISKANLARHIKMCSGQQHTTTQPQRQCQNCDKLITLSHVKRHQQKCMSASLKRKSNSQYVSKSTPKKLRLDEPSTSAIEPSTQSDIPTCRPTTLKRKRDNEPVPTSAPKTLRLDEPSTSSTGPSIMNSLRSFVVSAFNTAKSTVGNIVGGGGNALEILEIEKAFRSRMRTYIVQNKPNIKDPAVFLESARELVVEKIEDAARANNIKTNLVFLIEFKKPVNNKLDVKEMNFKTKNTVILPITNITEYFKEEGKKLLVEMEEFQAKESGWTLNKILNLELRINRYVPLRGSSYIELPQKLKSKEAVLNIQNNDEKCFVWSILAGLHPIHWKYHPYRIHHYQDFEHELDHHLDGISFPVSLDHVKVFEKRSGISINVYAYDEKLTIYPLIITERETDRHVDLLYIKEQNNTHYCYIKDLSRLVSSQLSRHHGKTWLCKRCLLHFGTHDLLKTHKEYCNEHEAVKITMPKEGDTLKFKDYNSSMRVPFVVYADFECMLTPIEDTQRTETIPVIEPSTKKYQKHDAVSFSYYIAYSDGYYKTPVNYFGTDAAQMFVERLLEESKTIYRLYSREAAIPMQLTEVDQEFINNAQQCHICGERFNENNPKVRDHDHLTGKFRGVAHNSCNLNYKKPSFIPVFIHNLTGYDTHLFIKMFGLNNETIDVIPNNEERYISYTINVENGVNLRFLDSLRFMASSLDALVKNLSTNQFKHSARFYSGNQLELLLKKGIYPYDYMDNIEKFEKNTLPGKEDFYNKLNMCEIEDKDYQHAVNVWNIFNIQNMKDYTLLYNQTDVLLLADVMENFRDVCLQTYQLDPAWYYTAPGLAWSAMLKTTGIELQLLSDYEMVLMIGKGIRGGLSQCSNRYAAANNMYMKKYYKKDIPTSYLAYLDANNLYGWAMSQYMPYSNFKWVEDASLIDISTIPNDGEIGYILEVDLEYPQELHDLHSDLPLAPERRAPPGSKQEKLLATLYDKEKYVIHFWNLKQYLALGLKLKKIHRAVSFSQKKWLQPYIDLNTNMRTRAKNDFEKDFFKLMNNSVFGKTMENIRNRVDIRLATQEKQVDKWLAQPNFKRRTIFTEQLAAIHMSKTKLFFNKAIYVGMSILDVSKTLMYDFHYNVIKARYGKNVQLQYTDTDSLTYLIHTDDFYKDVQDMCGYFDTSDYPPNHPCFSATNKKVIGKFKDELNGTIMLEHIGLRSKMYASRSANDKLIKKSKGVKKVVVEKNLTFQDYKDCLESQIDKYCSMNMIRSYKHDLYSVELNKISLSAHDDKRFILSDGITTLPWGHYKISQEQMVEAEIEAEIESALLTE